VPYVVNLPRKAEGVHGFVHGRTKVGAEVVRKVEVVAEEAASSQYLKMSNPHYGRWEHGLAYHMRVVSRKSWEVGVVQIFGVVER